MAYVRLMFLVTKKKEKSLVSVNSSYTLLMCDKGKDNGNSSTRGDGISGWPEWDPNTELFHWDGRARRRGRDQASPHFVIAFIQTRHNLTFCEHWCTIGPSNYSQCDWNRRQPVCLFSLVLCLFLEMVPANGHQNNVDLLQQHFQDGQWLAPGRQVLAQYSQLV